MIKYSIVMPALNEENYIRTPLISLNKQLDSETEIIVVDNECSDKTAQIAKDYGARVIKAPRGKLNARHAGIMAAHGSVIIATDADTYYPPGWLQKIKEHFKRPEVVAVGGKRTYDRDMLRARIAGLIRQRFFGGNSAFRKSAYVESGGFDLSVNQFSLWPMVKEEELGFKKRLKKHGKLVIDRSISVITSSRRYTDKDFKAQVKQGDRF